MAQMPQDNGGKNSKLRFLPLSHEDRPQIRLPPRPRSPPRKITLKSSLDIDHVSNRIITPKRKSREPSNNPRRAVHAHRRNPTVSPQQPCPSLSFEHAETYGDNDGLQYEEDKISDAADPNGNQWEPSPYQVFVEAVFSEECGFYQLSQGLFVVNGWNKRRNIINNEWYHLQKSITGSEVIIVCMCPDNRLNEQCFHSEFLRQYGETKFPFDYGDEILDNEPFLVTRIQSIEDGIYDNIFSIPAPRLPTIKNRAIVRFTGNDQGIGMWECSKDPKASSCSHISSAKHSLQQHIQADIHARDPLAQGSDADYHSQETRRVNEITIESVSYLPLPPPVWARIPSDAPPPIITPLESAPPTIALDPDSASCSCRSGGDRVKYNPFIPTERRPCIIYDLREAWKSTIDLQKCAICKVRYVGPDCRRIGLFNWNNRVLIAHHLLDEYTSAFTTSETPFAAWITVASRRYETKNPDGIAFLSEKMFRAAWFSYTRLLQLEGNMLCPKCGPTPKAVIFDGVSLAFNRKNVLESLRPPTTIHRDSAIRPNVIRAKRLQCIPDAELRKLIRRIITGPSLTKVDVALRDSGVEPSAGHASEDEISHESGSSEEEDVRLRNETRRKAAALQKNKILLERFKLIPQVVEKLKIINMDLGTLFDRHFGVDSVIQRRITPPVYSKLFIQIAAEETALQMMTYPALQKLLAYIHQPSLKKAKELLLIPAVCNVLQFEYSQQAPMLEEVIGVCRWLYLRGETVRQTLKVHSTEPPNPAINASIGDWKKTGCFYGLPQIRHRPQYPNLKEDAKADNGKEVKEGCRKFYSKYSPKKLTGGIMVAWCTHSISYGFHCLPVAEGRNDVFSALYTHWEKAPEIVVYDFACALEPYCMLREPEFFQDTLFVIDAFHAPDHTKCCPSSFLTTYCEVNPLLLRLNSSAGECGNGGLTRIRKSVSYMGQDRSIMYVAIFFAIWNRLRIREIMSRGGSL